MSKIQYILEFYYRKSGLLHCIDFNTCMSNFLKLFTCLDKMSHLSACLYLALFIFDMFHFLKKKKKIRQIKCNQNTILPKTKK